MDAPRWLAAGCVVLLVIAGAWVVGPGTGASRPDGAEAFGLPAEPGPSRGAEPRTIGTYGSEDDSGDADRADDGPGDAPEGALGAERAAGGAAAGAPEMRKPSATVLEAIRDLLSADRGRERRGRRVLRMAGPRIVPELRYWVHRVRYDADRVEKLIEEILRAAGAGEPDAIEVTRDMPVGDFFHRRFLEARDLAREGLYRKAYEIGEALLVLDESSPIAWELRRLVREARERVAAEALEPRIDVGELVYEVGDEPEVVFRLINRTREPAEIRLDRGILGDIDVSVTVRTMDGSQRVDRDRIILRTERARESISLDRGENWIEEIPFRFPRPLPLAGAVARVQIRGMFRPVRWEVEGAEETNISIHTVPAEFWVLPPGQETSREEPIKRLVAALVFGKQEGFLIGGQLSVWAGERDAILNEKLVATLMKHLGGLDPVRQRLAIAFLRDATGRGFKEVERWERWWKELGEKRSTDGGAASARRRLPGR